MLRDRIEQSWLEDFLGGLARTSQLRIAAYDAGGFRICVCPPRGEATGHPDSSPEFLPRPLLLVNLPADEPPAGAAFIDNRGVWFVVVPVQLGERLAGYLAVGEFREGDDPPSVDPPGGESPESELKRRLAWEQLPRLQRTGDSRAIVAGRWASRMLADWVRHEEQINVAADELALLGDIGELISGERDLRTVMDRITAEIARVMKCRYASIRLLDAGSNELRVAAVFNLTEPYIEQRPLTRGKSPIDDEALEGRMVYIEDARQDRRIVHRDSVDRLGIVSGLACGMIYHGQPIGVLRIYADHRRRFRAAQRNLLRAVASQAAMAIASARMIDQRLRSAELERQVELAGQVQARLVRAVPPRSARVETGLVFDPSSHVGGDFCDLIELPDGRMLAVVGDVVGHGVPAAMLMASVRGALRGGAASCGSLTTLMGQLNLHVFRETLPAEFVTLLMLAISPDGRSATLCNAGHEPPLILRGGRVSQRDGGGLVLGLTPDESYEESVFSLVPGDFVLLYTDGVIEAMDFDGRLFGRKRLADSLRLHGLSSPERALRSIHWDVRRFVGLAEQSDDLTMIGLKLLQQP